MENKKLHFSTARKLLIFWTIFIGIGAVGVTLMLWICIQFYMFPPNFMSTIFFIFGFCQAVTGYAAWRLLQQEERDAYC